MRYKTILLHLLEQRPELYDQLRHQRRLLPTLDRCSAELKTAHGAWKARLWQARPDSDESQIASEALEIALKEIEGRLLPESSTDYSGPRKLDHE